MASIGTSNLIFQITGSNILDLSSSNAVKINSEFIIDSLNVNTQITHSEALIYQNAPNNFWFKTKSLKLNRTNSNIRGCGILASNYYYTNYASAFGLCNYGYINANAWPFGKIASPLLHFDHNFINGNKFVDHNLMILNPSYNYNYTVGIRAFNPTGFEYFYVGHGDLSLVFSDAYFRRRYISMLNGTHGRLPDAANAGWVAIGTAFSTNLRVLIKGNMFSGRQLNLGNSNLPTTTSYVSASILPYDTQNSDMNIGNSSLVWNNLYANDKSGVSDRALKTDIKESKLGLKFINDLNPVKYRYKNGLRTHYGLIAQEVKSLLDKFNIDTKDFAGYVEGVEGNKFLRYEEFISLLIKAIQELSARIESLEKEIKLRGL